MKSGKALATLAASLPIVLVHGKLMYIQLYIYHLKYFLLLVGLIAFTKSSVFIISGESLDKTRQH